MFYFTNKLKQIGRNQVTGFCQFVMHNSCFNIIGNRLQKTMKDNFLIIDLNFFVCKFAP